MAEADRISLGSQGDGALWAATQAFWAESSTGLLEAVPAEGRKQNVKCFSVRNLGPLAHADSGQKRVREGMNLFAWAKATDLFLVEELQRPKHVLGGYILHNTLQYKLAFAAGVRAGMLLQAAYRLVDYFSERHILFDLITPSQIADGKLMRYEAVVTPSLKYLARNALTELRRCAAGAESG
jgi:hypothetical protein